MVLRHILINLILQKKKKNFPVFLSSLKFLSLSTYLTKLIPMFEKERKRTSFFFFFFGNARSYKTVRAFFFVLIIPLLVLCQLAEFGLLVETL